MARILEQRLNRVLDDAPWQRLHALPQAQWRGGIGAQINDVRALVVHETSGWPARAKQDHFDISYINAGGTGEFTQLMIAGDGTVFLGVELPRKTWHGNFVNHWSLGCETAHGQGHSPPAIPPPTNLWRPLNGVSDRNDAAFDDLPGRKLWWRERSFDEMVVSWWTTARFPGPQREAVVEPEMLFPEAQYRSWALLLRYVAEQFLVPRNFPVLPHKLRNAEMRDATAFRDIVRGDE